MAVGEAGRGETKEGEEMICSLEIPEALVGEESLVASLQDFVQRGLLLPNMNDGVLVQGAVATSE